MCASRRLYAENLSNPTNCVLEGITFNNTNGDSRSTVNTTNYQCSRPTMGNSFQGVTIHRDFTATADLPARNDTGRNCRRRSEAVAAPKQCINEEARNSRDTERLHAESQSFFLIDFRARLIKFIQILVYPITYAISMGSGDANEAPVAIKHEEMGRY
ncbi:hypothetical protein PM082_023973 [Marasmius tenuissimus]|nr:hypothetical protein PM082_023973 [Marasmius tenuissimus]